VTPAVDLRAMGPLAGLDRATLRALCDRAAMRDPAIRERTASLVDEVRHGGDAALRAQAQLFDGATLGALEIPREVCARALANLANALRESLARAARNIAAVHRAFAPTAVQVSPEPGVLIGRRPDPLDRVGVYVPGGRAAYPSSLLMGAIPARVAGVREVIVCSPAGPEGAPAAVVLAAAELANVDRVFAIGGAGAIAAMAFGTESVPRVDRIVGPGNAYVAEAKLQVVGQVAIDAPAGPSELLVIADASTDPAIVARELVAQAEHDPDAAVIAVVAGPDAARVLVAIESALAEAMRTAPRAEIVREALRARGALLSVSSEDAAIDFANIWAAEHVLLAVREDNREAMLTRLRSAGTVFLGSSSSVAFGDYMTGANHVLPTAGLARCYSGLSTLDFVRWTSWQRVTPDAAARLAADTACIADAEGLPGHAAAARAWMCEDRG
jgi:histidinol dehydrogenase